MHFADRADAGRRLAAKLKRFRGEPVIVLGLPRGGVPVAMEVARKLEAPLDVIVVRKLGVPFYPELGMGALGEDGVRVINPEVVRMAGVSEDELAEVQAREQARVDDRAARYRAHRARLPLNGKVAVVVDDGIATGSTARAACQVARAHGAARVVLAVPVAPPGWEADFHGEADELVCLDTPAWFVGIGQFYDDFAQTTDDEVIACLESAAIAASAVMNEPDGRSGHGDRGHRSVPHTADLRIEAWGPTREDCIAEAVRGLVESFADVSGTGCRHVAGRHLTADSDADLLAATIEEIIYGLDTRGEIPAAVEVSRAADGGIDLTLRLVDVGTAEISGAAPKAASLSGLTCAPAGYGRWSCAVTVDV